MLRGHRGCESCGQQSGPVHPTLPQSWRGRGGEEDERGGCRGSRRMSKDETRERQKKRNEERLNRKEHLFNHRYTFMNQAVNTHLMSWLYLARRSDRQGAPVLIWRKTKDYFFKKNTELLLNLYIRTKSFLLSIKLATIGYSCPKHVYHVFLDLK